MSVCLSVCLSACLFVIQHLTEQEAWLREQNKDLELAESMEEAKLQLGIFKRQYATLTESHDCLIMRGRELNQKITELDQELFGGTVDEGVGKEMGGRVERMTVKLGERKRRMEERASPRLKLLQECQQYFTYNRTAQEVRDWVTLCLATLLAPSLLPTPPPPPPAIGWPEEPLPVHEQTEWSGTQSN